MASFKDEYLEHLKSSIEFAYKNVPLYRERMNQKMDIQSFKDIQALPIFNKTDFENKPLFHIIGVSPEKLGISFATSGTKGRSFFLHLTYNDFRDWLIAKACDALITFVGITDSDVVVNTFGLGLIQPGNEYTFAAMEAGAQVYPVGPGILTPSQETIRILETLDVTTVFATPSYALRLTDVALEMGVNPVGLKIKRFIVTGETLTPAARNRIETSWRTEVLDIFGMAEIGVAAVECRFHSGLHILSDYLFPEVVNPETLSPKKLDEVGELVVTTLGKFGMPFVRYNTRDLVRMTQKACPCSISGLSIVEHLGRSDEMIKIKGKGIYPANIEQILLSTPEIGSEYQIIVEHGIYGDRISVLAETRRNLKVDEALKKRVVKRMREELGVNLEVKIYNYGKLSRISKWKTKRIVEVDVRQGFSH